MLKIATTPGTDNVDTFQAFTPDGEPYSFSAVTRVDIDICSERAALSGGVLTISSADVPPAVAFNGTFLSVRFGALSPYRGDYYPTVTAYDADNPNGVVLAGKGYPTEILLQVAC